MDTKLGACQSSRAPVLGMCCRNCWSCIFFEFSGFEVVCTQVLEMGADHVRDALKRSYLGVPCNTFAFPHRTSPYQIVPGRTLPHHTAPYLTMLYRILSDLTHARYRSKSPNRTLSYRIFPYLTFSVPCITPPVDNLPCRLPVLYRILSYLIVFSLSYHCTTPHLMLHCFTRPHRAFTVPDLPLPYRKV